MAAKLTGRVALVTGAGRGIGRAMALALAAEGAKVLVNDLDEEPAKEVVAEIRAAGGESVAHSGSVIDPELPAKLVTTALEVLGGLDIIINNAGYTWDANIHNMTEEQYDAMLAVHLKAPWRILKAASGHIRGQSRREAEEGRTVFRKVVNISSMSATRGSAGQTNYCAAKAGVVGLTRSLAKEWGRYRVNVNAVAFGFIDTRLTEVTDAKRSIDVDGHRVGVGVPTDVADRIRSMIPLGRSGTAQEAAGAALLFCYPESDYISGQLLEVTGGY